MKNYSQNNEQTIILDYLVQNNIQTGNLLDIGAYDGETYSNTRAIMLEFPKWKGVFVEPSSYSFYKLFTIYQQEPSRAELINLLIVEEEQLSELVLTEFYDSPTQSPASSINISNVNKFVSKVDVNGISVDPRKIFVGKIGLKELFYKFNNYSFEFINVDVEGNSAKLVLTKLV
jgi:hypothetical protein